MNDLMCSVVSQIQRAISEAINEQVLPQILATPRLGQKQVPRKGWKIPEYRSEGALNRKFRGSSSDEFSRNLVRDDNQVDTHYTC